MSDSFLTPQMRDKRDKKAFLSDQCKEIEENNRKGKTRDLFKNQRYQGNISCKDRHNKEQKWYGPDRRKYQEEVTRNTEELYKKDLQDPDTHDDLNTHLEPDILECEVKWASASISTNKTSGGDGIPAELFQILKDDALKVLHSISQQIW